MGSEYTRGNMGLSHNLQKFEIPGTPFRLVYGQEVVIPLECIVPSKRIVMIIEMTDVGVVKEIFLHLVLLEED